jgi:hypothetical protein
MRTSQKLTLFGGPSETDNMKPLDLWCALAHGAMRAGGAVRTGWAGTLARLSLQLVRSGYPTESDRTNRPGR